MASLDELVRVAEQANAPQQRTGAMAQYGVSNDDAERVLRMSPTSQPRSTRLDELVAVAEGQQISGGDAALMGFADTASLGALPRIAGTFAGVRAMSNGGDFRSTFSETVERARERMAAAREQRGLEYFGGAMAGGLNFMGLPGVGRAAAMQWVPRVGPALARAAAGRGVGAATAQAVTGGSAGALFGGAYGALSAAEGQELQGARDGAFVGAVGGAVFPALGQALGARTMNQRMMAGSVLGGGAGAAGGALVDRENPWRGAGVGAAVGAGAGAGVAAGARPAAMAAWNGVRGVGEGVVNAFRNPAGYARQTNAAVGLPPPPGGRPPSSPGRPDEPQINPAVTRAFDDLMHENADMSVADLRGRVANAIRNPMGPVQTQPDGTRTRAGGRVWADIFKLPGAFQTRQFAQGRGQTTELADARAQQRSRSLASHLVSELNTRLGIRQTPRQAGETLADTYERISNNHYNPIFERTPTVTGQMRETLDGMVQRLPPEVLAATQDSMTRVATMRGVAPLSPGQSRYYHKFYSGLGQTIRELERNPSAIEGRLFGPEDIAAMRTLRDQMRNVMDEAVPGHREARTSWAGLADAQDAMDRGRAFMSRNTGENGEHIWRPEDLAQEMQNMTPFEREHFRLGVADVLSERFMMHSRAVGQTNAANAFVSEGMQNLLEAVFERPSQARAFMQILNEGNELVRNSQTWLGGSSSYANTARAGSGFMSRLIEGAGAALRSPVSTVQNAALGGVRLLRESAALKDDNDIGRALLTFVDDRSREGRQFRRALLRELQALEDERGRRAASAGVNAAGGAIFPLEEAGDGLN